MRQRVPGNVIKCAARWLSAIIASLVLAAGASASTIVFDNMGSTNNCYTCNGNPYTNPTGYALGGSSHLAYMFRFNTGNASGSLDQITLVMPVLQSPGVPLPDFEKFTAHIYANDNTVLIPGPQLYSQSYVYSPYDMFGHEVITLPTSQTFFLDPNTTYWIGFDTANDSSLGWIYNQDISQRGTMARRVNGSWTQLPNAIVPALRITAVPVPAAVWLFGSALGVLGWAKKKTRSCAT
jgi:hypothetical protein